MKSRQSTSERASWGRFLTAPFAATARMGTLGKRVALLACLTALGGACGSADPEANSGGDAFRNEAAEMKLDELVTGELDRDGGDTTDWKFVKLEDPGKFTVTLSTDKKSTAVLVGVYDKFGVEVGVGAKKKGSEDAIKVPVNAKLAGKYFVRVEHRDGDKSTYSLKASLGQGGGGDVVPDI